MTRCQEPGYCSEVVNLKCSDPRRAISALASSRLCVSGTYSIWEANMSSTTIESRKFRIPSDLRRQPGYRPVSSKVGDHLRILLGVVVHSFLRWQHGRSNKCKRARTASVLLTPSSLVERRPSCAFTVLRSDVDTRSSELPTRLSYPLLAWSWVQG